MPINQRLCRGIGKILAGALSGLILAQGSHAKAATLLSPAPAFNARVARPEHAPRPEDRHWLVATALVPAGGKHVNIYLADRDNAPFRQIGEITDPAFGSGLCCGTRIYHSNDEGHSWSYLSEIRAAKPGGIWEPEFTVGSDGALILFFSDETDQAAHSQTIKKVRTTTEFTGATWVTWSPATSSATAPAWP